MDISSKKEDIEAGGPESTRNAKHDIVRRDSSELVVLGSDGFKLFPQPIVGDTLDPLNWTTAQKNMVLAIVMALYVI